MVSSHARWPLTGPRPPKRRGRPRSIWMVGKPRGAAISTRAKRCARPPDAETSPRHRGGGLVGCGSRKHPHVPYDEIPPRIDPSPIFLIDPGRIVGGAGLPDWSWLTGLMGEASRIPSMGNSRHAPPLEPPPSPIDRLRGGLPGDPGGPRVGECLRDGPRTPRLARPLAASACRRPSDPRRSKGRRPPRSCPCPCRPAAADSKAPRIRSGVGSPGIRPAPSPPGSRR